jgi:alpha/beta superfamily hydrolase
MVAAGFPTGGTDISGLALCRRPKVFIQSTHDAHGPKAELEVLFGKLPEPKRLIWIPARDHFFDGALSNFEEAVFSLGSVAGSAVED